LIYCLIGLIYYFNQKQYEKAIEIVNQIFEIDPSNERAFVRKIASLRELRRFPEAENVVQEALAKLPKNIDILSDWAYLYFYQKQYEKAIEILNQIFEIDASNERAFVGTIASLTELRRFPEAENIVQEALAKLPKNIEILYNWVYLYFYQKQYEKAIEIVNQIFEIDPSNEEAFSWKIASLRELRRFPEAANIVQEALAKLPKNIEILHNWAYLYFYQKQYERAIEIVNQIFEIDPSNERAFVLKIASLRELRRFPDAKNVAREAMGKLPKSTKVLAQLGRLYFNQNQLEKAQNIFSETVKDDPYNNSLKYNQVEILIRLNRCHEALEILRSLKKLYPIDLDVLEQTGKFYIRRNDPISAKKEFESILDKELSNVSGLKGLGLVYFNQNRYIIAEELFRKARSEDQYDPEISINLAKTLIRQENEGFYKQDPQVDAFKQEVEVVSLLDEAEDLCKSAIKLSFNSSDSLGCLGIIIFMRGRVVEAEDCLRQSIEVDPMNGKYADLGALQVQMGKFEEAGNNLKKAIETNRYDVKAHIELGNLFLRTERSKDAIKEFRQAISFDPASEDAVRALAIALMQVGDYAESERTLRTAIRNLDESKIWRLHLTLSRLLVCMGDSTDSKEFYEDALNEVKKAIKIRPDHPDPYSHAGIVRFKLKDYWGAKKSFDSCLKRDKNNFEAERNIRIISPLIYSETIRSNTGIVGGLVIGLISMLLLSVLWGNYLYSKESTTSDTLLITVTIVSLGLIVIAFLLPSLVRLQLPGGFIAELSQPKETISSGPTGEIGFSTSLGSGSETGLPDSLQIGKGPN